MGFWHYWDELGVTGMNWDGLGVIGTGFWHYWDELGRDPGSLGRCLGLTALYWFILVSLM